MQRISTSATPFFRFGIFLFPLFLGLIFISMANEPRFEDPWIAGAVLVVITLVAIVSWWHVLRKLAVVTLNDSDLTVRRGKNEMKVPFDRIVSVEKMRFGRRPPVAVSYRADDGTVAKFIFLPSVRVGGLFLTADNVIKLLRQRLPPPSTASA